MEIQLMLYLPLVPADLRTFIPAGFVLAAILVSRVALLLPSNPAYPGSKALVLLKVIVF